MASDTFPVLVKDPGSHEDFSVNWASYLTPTTDSLDSVLSVTVDPVVSGGVSVLAPPTPPGGAAISISSTLSIAWLTGGVAGRSYVVTFRVRTSQGRTVEQSIRIKVEQL